MWKSPWENQVVQKQRFMGYLAKRWIWWRGDVPLPNPQAGGPPLVCPVRLLTQYLRSCPQHLQAFPSC